MEELIKEEIVEELDQSLNQHENDGVPEDSLIEVKEEPSYLEVKPEQEYEHQDEHEHEQEQELEQEQKPEQEREQQEDVAGIEGGGERWPGWPGESVFRMLVPAQKVGSIIGRKGEFIKKMCEEAKARIKILDGPPGTSERAVMVSAKEEPEASLPPAIDGLLKVHRRVVDGLETDSSHPPPAVAGKVSTRLLVPASQAGSLIGKQGTTVKSIQEASSCIVRVLGQEDLPIFALQDDRIVEVVGDPASVHKAIELIASQLRKFLVDRGIISVFEKQMQMPNQPVEHMPPPQSWGPPPQAFPLSAAGGPGYGSGPHFMPPPRQHDSYYPPADMPPPMEKPHQGISAYGREAPMAMQSSSNNPTTPSMITQVTQQMQVPLAYADAVIGTNGASISYIRRVSGATVTIQETRGVPGEMTVEINGTASQVQTAQQLIQNFMADAGAPQAQTVPPADQGYNSYGAPPPTSMSSMYSSAPPNAGQQSGGYGSVYGYGAYGN